MASKRVNENQRLNTSKISRSTIITPFSTSMNPIVSDEPVDLTAINTDLDNATTVFPDFFADQAGNGTVTEFDESEPHTAFHNSLQEFVITPKTQTRDLIKFLNSLAHKLETSLPDLLSKNHGMKVWLVVRVNYTKIDDESKSIEAFHKTRPFLFVNSFQIREEITKMLEQILTESAHFMREGSGYVYQRVGSATVQIAQHQPLVGEHHTELPLYLAKKQAIINVRNTDTRCFGYAIVSALHPSTTSTPNRPTQYDKFFEQHRLHNLNYPIAENDIPAIEDLLQIRINLFSFSHEGHRIYPVYTSIKPFEIEIDLLHWDGHYAWIKSFSRLLYNITKHKEKKYFCKACFGHFSTDSKLNLHKQFCENGGYAGPIYTMPPPGKILKFINIRNEMPLPFKIFADCEALTQQSQNPVNSPIYQNHVACSVGLKLISSVPAIQADYWQCRGANCIEAFLSRLLEIEKICIDYLFDDKRMIFTQQDSVEFRAAIECYICKKKFVQSTDKVRDHCHISGKYRCAAHSRCNLQLRKTYKIPVFFHNWRGYDSHLIVHKLPNYPDLKVNIIGQSMEKYLVLNWGEHLVFKDALQFMNCSLEKLVANLLKSGRENFKQILTEYSGA